MTTSLEFTKAYILSMVGKMGPLVFLLSDDSMSSNDFRCCSVQGLTVGFPRAGYICFCKTTLNSTIG